MPMDTLASPVAEILDFIAQESCTDAQFDRLALRPVSYTHLTLPTILLV